MMIESKISMKRVLLFLSALLQKSPAPLGFSLHEGNPFFSFFWSLNKKQFIGLLNRRVSEVFLVQSGKLVGSCESELLPTFSVDEI